MKPPNLTFAKPLLLAVASITKQKIHNFVDMISSVCKLVFAMLYPTMNLCTFLQSCEYNEAKIHQAIISFEAVAVNLALVKLCKVPYNS
ncbi:hypothetical protein [Campylobacter troglodytis]|uniref:hypothetical protein n=1 Tax=Campylobacter troglodytis TaxID=654363 RepID=UPI00115BDB24|nr:hypothetical protein [Campylobacter troglodytis]